MTERKSLTIAMSPKTIEAAGKRANQNTDLEKVQDYSQNKISRPSC